MSSTAFHLLCMRKYFNDALLVQITKLREIGVWVLKKERKKKDIKNKINERKRYIKRETPTPSPRFTDTRALQRISVNNTLDSDLSGG